ncbi:unnamed protein product [Closterium sp. Yama58-4]|nr:unnamed protein product [Closterium sp. Yama58-4]
MAPFISKLSLLWRPARVNAGSTAKSSRCTDKSVPSEPRVSRSSTSPASIQHISLTADPPDADSIEASDTQALRVGEQCPDSCCVVPAATREIRNEPAHEISSGVRRENVYSMTRLADGLFGSCSVARRGHTISIGSNGTLTLDVVQSLQDNDDFPSRPPDTAEATEQCSNLDNDVDLESPYPTAIIHRSSTGGSSSVDTVTCAAVTPALPINKPANGGSAGDGAPLSPSLGSGPVSPPPSTAFISSTPTGGSASARTPRLRVSFAPLRADDESDDRRAEVAAEGESGRGGRRRNAAAGAEGGETLSVSGAVAGEGGRVWENGGCGERAGESAESTGNGYESLGAEADGRTEGGPRGTAEQPPGPQAKSAQPAGSSRQGNKGAPRAVVGERRKGRRFEHMVVTIPDREDCPASSGARSATGGKRTAEGRVDGESGGTAGKERGTRDAFGSGRGIGGGGGGWRGGRGGGERPPSEERGLGSFSFNAGDDRDEPSLERNITWTAGGGSSRAGGKGGKSAHGESSFAQRAAVTRRDEWGSEGRRGQESGAEWQVSDERSRSGRMVSEPQLNKTRTLSGPLTVSRRALAASAPRGAGEGRSRAVPVAPTPRSAAKGLPTPRARQDVSPPWALNNAHASRSFTDRPGPSPARGCASPRSRSFKDLPGRGAPPAIPPSPRAPKGGGTGASSNALSPRSPPAWSSASAAPAPRDAPLAAMTPRSARAGGGGGPAGNGGGSAGSRKQQRGAEERERRRDEKEEQKMAQAMRIMEKLRSEARGGEGEKEGEEGREEFEAEEDEGEEWEPFHSRPPALASNPPAPPHFPQQPQQQLQPCPRWQQPHAVQQARGSGGGRAGERDGGAAGKAATYSGPSREQRPLRRAQSYETGYRAVTDGMGRRTRTVGRGDGGTVRGGGGGAGGGGAAALVSPNSDGVMYDRVQGRACGYVPEQSRFPLPHGLPDGRGEVGGMGWGSMQMPGQGAGAAGWSGGVNEQQGGEGVSWGYGDEGGVQGDEDEKGREWEVMSDGREWEVVEVGGGNVGSGGRGGRGGDMHGGSGGMYKGENGQGRRTGSNRNRSGTDWCYMAQVTVPLQAGSGEQRWDGEEAGEQEGSELYSDGDEGNGDLYCEAKEEWRGDGEEDGSGEWFVEDDDVAVARAVTTPVDGQGQQRWGGGGDGAWEGRNGRYGEEDEE